MRRALFAVIFGLAALSPTAARAEPSLSTLSAIERGSTLVAIVRFAGPAIPRATGYDFVVERALRGSATPSATIHVNRSPDGHAYLSPGTRVVAFVDASGTWNAYASVLAGPSLEDGVLRLQGFDDFDAHLVTPGVMTLAQLEASVRGAPVAWTFRGKVLLATPSGLAPSSIEVTARAPSNAVAGMPRIAGFPSPTVAVDSWGDPAVSITWNRDLGRPLVLEGTPVGKNADGSIAVEYRASYPGLLTEADFRRYLGDARLGHPYYTLRVEMAGGSVPVVLDREIGRIGTLGGAAITATSLAPSRRIDAGGTAVALAPSTYRARSGGTTNALVEEAMVGPIACTFVTPAASTPCRLRYLDTRFASP